MAVTEGPKIIVGKNLYYSCLFFFFTLVLLSAKVFPFKCKKKSPFTFSLRSLENGYKCRLSPKPNAIPL